MPTENRSSNTEQMVSVPRDEVERLVKLLQYQAHPYPSPHAEFWQGLLDAPVAQHQSEPIIVEAVAVTREDDEGLRLEWLLEGGIAALEFPGQVLLVAHGKVTDDKGSGEVYLHPPTSDGFSAGDMADQGAKAFRDGQQAAIPEGFALVPKEMLLSKEVIGVINFHCGDSAEEEGGQFGKYTDGRLWVGNVTDDDGSQVHGLHIMTDEYPEEGSTTLVEFPPPSSILPE
ncbi:hypothetical protein [Pseudomonas sp. DG56-2]|uniref:hypothetical protein n=1 Tax=Pseudomonas sp. DG56-2 TaxID=2320270 RepID=UPI002113AF20|nr:hypothetical protein [Pseudomonas sp. DG56-2]